MLHLRFAWVLCCAWLLCIADGYCLGQAVAEPETKSAQRPDGPELKEKDDDASRASKARKRDKNRSPKQFMRIRKDSRGRAVSLETSVTRYELKKEDGERITVDLIGVVHIGEQEYYEALNKRFKQYEGLLYELVAPEGTVIPKGGRDAASGLNPVAALQKGMQSVLGLEFQLDHIDYTKDNFVHADMTPSEFAESMSNNDESVSKYALRAIGQSMAMQNSGRGGNNMGMLFAMFGKNKEVRMRRVFAEQMQEMEAGLIMFEGRDGSTIIDHRNAKCMEVLDREIKSGKKNLAIFYGAGHLPDMERRLMSEFKMKRGGQYWLTAWSLQIPARSKDGPKADKD